ncbi:hypothetical protein HPP92_009305 [Vanilla planifolia]|uniref:Uncharacterized protein n=1 Tax=Vanilla planifolia TaxID=51239 RepID=A0A835V827_VANPL|nr:hypothetical protein HPP92_009305 [Vanilla planifolia]
MPVMEFHFDRGMMETYKGSDSCLDLYQQHHHYYSAPSSPNAFTASSDAGSRNWQSSIPFEWEEKPGTRNSYNGGVDVNNSDDFDFAFAFDSISKRREKVSYPPLAAADELFEKGVIRPLKPPPRLSSPVEGEQSPKSPKNRVFFSPLRRGRGRTGKELDPFAVAMKETTGERVKDRNRNYTRSAAHSMSYSRSRKGSRSLSPFRGRGGSRRPSHL